MTMHIEKQTSYFGSWTTVSLDTLGISNMRLTKSLDHATEFSFTMIQPQFSWPLNMGDAIRMWDDAGTDPDSASAFSSSNPTFIGYVDSIQPRGSNLLEITCYDPTFRANEKITAMSGAWNQGDVSGPTYPETGVGTYPRLVFNATIISDPDYAYARAKKRTVGEMISTVLDDQYQPLYWGNAAPGDGTDAGNGSPYESSDLTGMKFQPQEKYVFETEQIRSTILRLLEDNPKYKLQFYPGTKKWRFIDITAAAATTITLNDYTGTHDVLTADITRSIAGRATAVRFFGPEKTEFVRVSTLSGAVDQFGDPVAFDPPFTNNPSLLNISTSVTLQAAPQVKAINKLRIANVDYQRVARLLPTDVQVAGPALPGATSIQQWYTTREPTVLVRYPLTSAGTDQFQAVYGWTIDWETGTISFPETGIFRYNDSPTADSLGNKYYFELPEEVVFVYGAFTTAIETRYPETGFDGTAYSVGGLEIEEKHYDEMLALGYLFGVPITSTQRLSQFKKLAQNIHEMKSDLVYTGSIVIEGIEYDPWFHCDRKINIAAVDQDGAATTTGLESAGMFLTDVEYDFDQMVTTLSFSSDQMSEIGINIDQQKQMLKIRAAQLVMGSNFSWSMSPQWKVDAFGRRYLAQSIITSLNPYAYFIDPVTGEILTQDLIPDSAVQNIGPW